MSADWRSRIEIRQGDLTDSPCDAIVNAANTHLMLGAGVAGAIRRKGGAQIQAECDRIGPVPLGGAAITSGGKLKARYVIHAAGMHPGGTVDETSLRDATRNALRVAARHQVHTMAFPAIGTGVGGFPMRRCAAVMLQEIRSHLRTEALPRKIEMVLFDSAAAALFEAELHGLPD